MHSYIISQKYIKLNTLGYSQYALTIEGKLYKISPIIKELKRDRNNRFYIKSDCGIAERITLKELYRKAYNTEYCIDNISNINGEEWREIQGTNGRYYISNCGRVKSLCKYSAMILKPYKKKNGYFVVKINGKNIMIHRLVAFAFCDNKYTGQKVEIHHKDFNRSNNNANNLIILSIEEHHKIHNSKGTIKQ